jgi:hypothetical protein
MDKVYRTPQELEQMGDAIDLLKDEPEFKEIFLKEFPHIRQEVEEQIKEREDVEKILNEIQN